MVDFARLIAPVEIEIDGRVHLVPPPTLRQAVTVFAGAQAVGDESAWAETKRQASEWLGEDVAAVICADQQSGIRTLIRMLTSSVPDAQAEKQRKVASVPFRELVAEYAAAWGVLPSAVLDEPWPLFVAFAPEVQKQRAREQIRQAEWYASAKTGNMEALTARAGFATPAVDEPMDDEWVERQLERVRQRRQRQKAEA